MACGNPFMSLRCHPSFTPLVHTVSCNNIPRCYRSQESSRTMLPSLACLSYPSGVILRWRCGNTMCWAYFWRDLRIFEGLNFTSTLERGGGARGQGAGASPTRCVEGRSVGAKSAINAGKVGGVYWGSLHSRRTEQEKIYGIVVEIQRVGRSFSQGRCNSTPNGRARTPFDSRTIIGGERPQRQ
jgi:hypothetical protein